MRSTYFSFLLFFFLLSCNSADESEVLDTESKTEAEESMENLIAKRWIYKEKTKKDSEDRFSYEDGSSDVVLKLEKNGFFMIYDSITDPKLIEQGVRRIEQRSSGQWELTAGDLLLLRKLFNDTIIVDTLRIQSVDKDKLITETADKTKRTYFSAE